MKLTLATILLLLIFRPVSAETLTVGFHDFPPMMIQHQHSGIYKEIFKAIEALTGDKFSINYYPVARLHVLFEQGQLDIEPGISPLWRKGSTVPGVFSIPFNQSVVLLLFQPGKAFDVTAAKDLENKQLGTIRGYFYSGYANHFSSGKITRLDMADEKQLMEFLFVGRVEQIFIEQNVALYWMKQKPRLQTLEFGNVIESADISMRVHPDKTHILPRINTALRQLIDSGKIADIYQRYR